MEGRNEKKEKITGDDIEKVTLEPITKSKSKEDKELQQVVDWVRGEDTCPFRSS
jgi:hypothetical protein